MEVDSKPSASYQWLRFYDNSTYSTLSTVHSSYQNNITISNVTEQDLGQYKVFANNSYGGLNVTFSLVPEGEYHRTSCSLVSPVVLMISVSSPIALLGIIPLDLPDPPTILVNETRAAAYSITIRWLPGWNGGPQQTFTIAYMSDGADETLRGITDSGGVLSQKLTKGISQMTLYTIVIYATNEKGDGPSVSWPIISTPGKISSTIMFHKCVQYSLIC